LKNKKVLLTGCTGFIGSHLSKELLSKGYKVYALLRHSPRPTRYIPKGVVSIRGDLLDLHSLIKALDISQPSYIFHLAAMTPVRYSFTNPFIYEAINYRGAMNLIHAALRCPVLGRFIHASTMEVYKHKGTPLKETDELYGSTPYGVSKVAADYYVQVAGDCFGLPWTILRPCNTYGRKTEKGYLIEKIVTSMLTNNKLELNGRPDSARSFMYVDDHVRAYLYCMKEEAKNQVFNFGPKRANTVEEVVETSRRLLNWKGDVIYGTNPRPSEALKLEIDASKAKRILNWETEKSLEEGLRYTIEHWRKEK